MYPPPRTIVPAGACCCRGVSRRRLWAPRGRLPRRRPLRLEDAGDPYENTNRSIFNFNQGVDRTVLVPVANAYRAVLPRSGARIRCMISCRT